MRVTALGDRLLHASLLPGASDPDIQQVTNDSRSVDDGSLYAALRGLHVDGHSFIAEAIRKGARAILCEEIPAGSRDDRAPDVAWFVATDARMALSELSDRFYGSPSAAMDVVGVTGTDGKTSTTYMIHQLLTSITGSSAFLSTAASQIGEEERPNLLHQSTPEAPEVHRVLAAMLAHGSKYAVLESTSHGLSKKSCRLAHVRYRAAVYTNLSHEHLEYHGSFEQYRNDKANLFRALDSGFYADSDADAPPRSSDRPAALPVPGTPFGVVNRDDRHADYFERATSRPVVGYAVSAPADYTAAEVRLDTTSSSFTLRTPTGSLPCRIPVPGLFNVSNALAAAATVQTLTGCSSEELAAALSGIRSVRGRMTVVQSEPFAVVIDYAHTPGSFERVLPFFREQTRGRLILVFGSAGDRDVAKRSLQGAIADRYADIIVLADEDPRSEEPMEILRQIAAGCPSRRAGETIHLVPDRRVAIRTAFRLARTGDTVVLLGKGHETSIIAAAETLEWDEMAVAREELRDYQ